MKTEILEKLIYWEPTNDYWELCRQGDFYFVRYDRGQRTKVETGGKGKEGLKNIIEYFTNPHPIKESFDNDESFEIKKHIWFKEMEFASLCKKYLK